MRYTRKKVKLANGSDKFSKKASISTFICITNPITRGDTYLEAIRSHLQFSDELVVVDGGSTDGSLEQIEKLNDPRIKIVTLPWPKDWCWSEFATHWNLGYSTCTGDWVAAGETDHIWHEDQALRVKEFLNFPEALSFPIVAADKFQTVTIDRGFSKSSFPYFVNKRKYGDSIGYGYDPNNHSDLAAPIFKKKEIFPLFYEGDLIKGDMYKKYRIQFINYVWSFKTSEMIVKEREAGFNGWRKFYYSKPNIVPYPAGDIIKNVIQALENSYLRLERCTKEIKFSEHPKIMKEKLIKDLKPGMFGFDLCGWNNGHSLSEDYLLNG